MLPPLGPAPLAGAGRAGRPGVHTEVVIEAGLAADGVVESAVWAAGSLGHAAAVCGSRSTSVRDVWGALGLPGVVAGERMAAAGRALAGVLLSPGAQELVAGLLDGMTAEDTAEVVLCADGQALALAVELIPLRTAAWAARWGCCPQWQCTGGCRRREVRRTGRRPRGRSGGDWRGR